jgi:hypothetical protein
LVLKISPNVLTSPFVTVPRVIVVGSMSAGVLMCVASER